MEKVNKKVILLALAMAAITTFMIYTYIKRSTSEPDERTFETVYTAAKDIAPGVKIKKEDIESVMMESEYITQGAVKKPEEIIGSVADEKIYKGEQILVKRLLSENSGKLSFNIPKGKRAVSIFVNRDTGVSDMIEPGDYVDVFVSFDDRQLELPDSRVVYPRISGTLLQNVLVLAINEDMKKRDDMVVSSDSGNIKQKTVTLAIEAEDGEKLAYAVEFGMLRLALRPHGEDDILEGLPALREDLFDSRSFTIPKD